MGGGGGACLAAVRPSQGDCGDLLPRLFGGRGGGHPRHTRRDREVAYVLRAEGAQTGPAGTGAGAVTKPMECAEARLALGVYVLGAIDTVERTQVDAHLAGCHDCRDELAGLAGLPALLSRVDTAEAMALAESDGPPSGEETAGHGPKAGDPPPRELLATVINLTSARRRRRVRDAILAAAAAVVIAAGVVGGLRLSSSTPSPAQTAAFPVGPAAGPWQTMDGHAQDMTATVQFRSM